MDKSIFEIDYKIRSVNINTNKKLGLFGLLGLLQDTASEHADHLDFGYETMKEMGCFWVLVRQKLKMDIWPKWHDVITIKTWTIPADGFYAVREFEIYLNDKKLGECSTTWMILGDKDRKPIEVNKARSYFTPRTDFQLDFQAKKIKLPKDIDVQRKIEVKISDLDMNRHVNNIKYSQWVLDTIPFEYHKTHSIAEYEINFMSETFLGDFIVCSSTLHNFKDDEVYFSGLNERTSKIAFISKIITHEK
ncbi:acyl-[acyl-carrier-protein] thioesterase [Aureivirga sp. CE67]|uniref:acyl-[acyl-carrier-protein] thioesterase n=1 Tax=Aureivirga sp. CE67 TaxID=1788983 RepID=UPI0018CB7732|nr:acyl-ACP thioesterase domain-containing protein [Aureivirga sp. CE67]